MKKPSGFSHAIISRAVAVYKRMTSYITTRAVPNAISVQISTKYTFTTVAFVTLKRNA